MLQIFGVGHLGGDPEMRYTPAGKAVTNFSLAVKWGFGEYEQKAWLRVTTWGNLAEACNQYLKKGDEITFVATLNPDKETGSPKVFQKQDKSFGSAYEVTATEVKFHTKGQKKQDDGFEF